jgi:hypothetical protein
VYCAFAKAEKIKGMISNYVTTILLTGASRHAHRNSTGKFNFVINWRKRKTKEFGLKKKSKKQLSYED